MAPDLEELARLHPDMEVHAIHDDVFALGPIEKMKPLFDDYRAIASRSNTTVNPGKSEILYFDTKPISEEMLKWMADEKIKLKTAAASVAGAIVAKDAESASSLIQDELTEQLAYQERILHPKLSCQNANILLRSCALAKSSYTCRATEFPLIKEMLRAVDVMTYETYRDKMALQEFTDSQYAEWKLPIRLGGCGYRSQEDISPMAWFATQAQIAPILMQSRFGTSRRSEELRRRAHEDIEKLMKQSKSSNDSLKQKLPPIRAEMNSWYSEDVTRAKHLQADLSKLITEQTAESLPKNAVDKERRKANGTPEASWFHRTLPLTARTTIPNGEYRLKVRQKFGMRASNLPNPEKCLDCGTELSNSDEDTWHPLSCKRYVPTDQSQKHHEVVQLIATTVAEIGGAARVEQRQPCSPNDKQRMDVIAYVGMANPPFLVDVTNRTFMAPSRRDKPDRMIAEAEAEKKKKYKDYQEQGYPGSKIVPFVTDEIGRIGPDGRSFMTEVWSYGENSGKPKEDVQAIRQRFYADLSCTLVMKSMEVEQKGLDRMHYAYFKQQRKKQKTQELERKLVETLQDNHSDIRMSPEQPQRGGVVETKQSAPASAELNDLSVFGEALDPQRGQSAASKSSELALDGAPDSSANSVTQARKAQPISNRDDAAKQMQSSGQSSQSADSHAHSEPHDGDVEMKKECNRANSLCSSNQSWRNSKENVAKEINQPGQSSSAVSLTAPALNANGGQARKQSHDASKKDSQKKEDEDVDMRQSVAHAGPEPQATDGRLPMEIEKGQSACLAYTSS